MNALIAAAAISACLSSPVVLPTASAPVAVAAEKSERADGKQAAKGNTAIKAGGKQTAKAGGKQTAKGNTTAKAEGKQTAKGNTAEKAGGKQTAKGNTTAKAGGKQTAKGNTTAKAGGKQTAKGNTAEKKAPPARAKAAPGKHGRESDIDAYLRRIQRLDPYAVITGWFDDWRDVSIYRSHAGYHLGYDIGLLAGFAVPSGWAGTIVDIVPWSQNEWGVYLETKDGYIISFGHLHPTVKVGTKIEPGMTVGTVAVNHVDIKVRDPKGRYIDIGKTSGLLAIDPSVIFYMDTTNYNISKVDISKIIKAKQKELAKLKGSMAILNEYLEAEKDILAMMREDTERSRRIYESSLISKSELETREIDEKKQELKVKDLKTRLDFQKKNMESIRAFLKKNGAKEPAAVKKEKKIKETDRERLEEAKRQAEKYRELYEEGAVSRKTAEEKEREYKRLRLEIMLKTEEQ